MDITAILSSFAHDKQLALVLFLIAADVVLGVLAAFKMGTFRLSYLSNFARNDLLGKVVPWFAVFALDKASHAANIVGPVDFSQVATAAFAAVTLAMGGSILSSLADLGLNLPVAIAGHAPPVVTSAATVAPAPQAG
jgi:hypothetical protein